MNTNTCVQCGYEYETLQCPCKFDSISVPGYNLATLDDFNPNVVRVILSDIRKSKHKCFLLHGPSGTGKTHMAVSLARYFCSLMEEDRMRFKFGLLHPFKLSRLPSKREEQIEDFLRCDVLIVDEFSNELFDIAYQRIYGENKITIFTTNASLDNLDPRLVWRLKSFELTEKVKDIDTLYHEKEKLYSKFEEYKRENFENDIDLSDLILDGISGYTGIQDTTSYFSNFKV